MIFSATFGYVIEKWNWNTFVIALRSLSGFTSSTKKRTPPSSTSNQNKQTEHEIQLFLLATSEKQAKEEKLYNAFWTVPELL